MERTAYISNIADFQAATDEYLYTEIVAGVDAETHNDFRPPLTRFEQILNDPELHTSMHTPDYFMLVE